LGSSARLRLRSRSFAGGPRRAGEEGGRDIFLPGRRGYRGGGGTPNFRLVPSDPKCVLFCSGDELKLIVDCSGSVVSLVSV
jgi:hypothetical protein